MDDDTETLDLLKAFLESNGHTVQQANRGKTALDLFRAKPAPLVFLDVRLPDTDGLELLKAVKAIRSETSVVIMTGFREAEVVVEAFRNGALDCVLKPFNFEYLKFHILTRFNKT
ncbi:MAG: response regulator [Elusimicrobia bacterium]|nr:response regulator [Elusimicrobiota bacterium]